MRIVRILLLILLAVLLLPYLVTPFYRTGHPVSALMAWRWLTGAPVSRQWVDFNAISPALPRSVVGSEDAKFCSHRGVDWGALQDAIDDAEDGEPARGGSTITQQVAKNLFLWPGRSVVRKGLELPLAMWIDLVLPKQRILGFTSTSPNSGRPDSSGRKQGRSMRSAARPRRFPRARRPCWRRSCPIRSGAAPGSPARGSDASPGPIWRGRGQSSAAGAKIVLFEPIFVSLSRRPA